MRRIMTLLAGSAALTACASTASVRPDTVDTASGGVIENPKFKLAEIKDRDGEGLDRVLGAPDLVRIEGRGEFRRYTLSTCALLVTLYPDDAGVRRVRSVEAGALKSGDEKPDLNRCLAYGR